MKLRLLEIGRVARAKGPVNQDKLKQRYAPVAGCNEPGGGTGKALLRGDRRRSEAVEGHSCSRLRWMVCAKSLIR